MPVQAQTREIDAPRARAEAGDAEAGDAEAGDAEAGDAEAQHTLGSRYFNDADSAEEVRWLRLAAVERRVDTN